MIPALLHLSTATQLAHRAAQEQGEIELAADLNNAQ